MENSAGKSLGGSRSLDLQSLCKSSGSRRDGSRKRKGGDVVGDGEVRKRKRKDRKDVSLSRFEQAVKNGGSSDLPDSGKSQPGLSGNADCGIRFGSIAINLGGAGNAFLFPKRRRDFVGRSKFAGSQQSRSSGASTSIAAAAGSSDPVSKSNGECKRLGHNQGLKPPGNKACSDSKTAGLKGDSALKVDSSEVNEKITLEHLRKSMSTRVKSGGHGNEDNGHTTLNYGDAAPRKRRNNQSKRKRSELGSESQRKKVELLADSATVLSNDSLDEDEENLEQNAARMLSSRFDPSCTRSSAKNRLSPSPSTKGFSLFETLGQDSNSRGENAALTELETASVDSANKVLRPRKQHKGKGGSRIRRHFYEVTSRDFDAHWVLNKRIKVFWPLDESWYVGLVNDYDPEKKIHHIKYDDRDEEWIDLHKERFKLLLLPAEAPHKTGSRSVRGLKHYGKGKKDSASDDDNSVDNNMESEPIISWLARSSSRVKSSTMEASKRRKPSYPPPDPVPCEVSTKTHDATRLLDISLGEKDVLKPSGRFSLIEASDGYWGAEHPVLEIPNCYKDGNPPAVYVRKRYRKKDERYDNAAENDNTIEISHAPFTTPSPVVCSIPVSNSPELPTGQMVSEGLLWSIDDAGLLRLNTSLIESKQFRLNLDCEFPSPLSVFGGENTWLFRTLMLLRYGTLVTVWPKVHLEMLFVDNFVGLRFLFFEGSLKQAVSFVSMVLRVFYEPNEQGKYLDMQIPVTSVRFKLSRCEDSRKQYVFAFHSFSKLKCSKWLYLDSKLQQHCLLAKQLALSECTYDNIKALEGGSIQANANSSNKRCSAFEGSRKKSRRAIIPRAAFKESCSIVTAWTSSDPAANHENLPQFAICFAAAPTFFRSLHLKLLMENSVASISLRDHNSEHRESTSCSLAEGQTGLPEHPTSVPEITSEGNLATSMKDAKSLQVQPIAKSQPRTGVMSAENCNALVKSPKKVQNGKLNVTGTSAGTRGFGEDTIMAVAQSQTSGCTHLRCDSSISGLSVAIPSLGQVEPADGKAPSSAQSHDLNWNMTNGNGSSPNTNLTGRRDLCHKSRNCSSTSNGDTSPFLRDGKEVFISSGFGNGPKKPRTQVQYTLPSGGFDCNSRQKMHNQRGLPFKRIRRTSDKRTLDDCRSPRTPELLACDANVLITNGDRGWRSSGARVILEITGHNEWRLAVKISGSLNYSYKANQLLQPGSTNRYTHAMMWRGGKDWVLEFPDRSQWTLFKEIYEECYNRNLRAASVKNIPIPGVRLIEESDESRMRMAFIRSSSKYLRQLETDIDIAMDPSHVVYDMDSDDESWVSENQGLLQAHKSKFEEMPDEFFERIMDMFEKISYAQQSDHLTSDEIDNLMGEVGPMEVILAIHEHWRMKRKMKGMPLIRHLQPPLWERYEQKVKEWELARSRASASSSIEGQGKAPPAEKPPMFAFCLKPRGMEVPNKGSKQRSQRRISISGHSHGIMGDQDGHHASGRRSNGLVCGDEKGMFHGNGHEYSDTSPLYQASTRGFSPRNPTGSSYMLSNNDSPQWNHRPKHNRNTKSKKIACLSPSNSQMVPPHNQRAISSRNGVHQRNMGLAEWPNQKHYHQQVVGGQRRRVVQFQGSDIDEFRARDLIAVAQRAVKRARFKKEQAQKLHFTADSAIHRAVAALMTAEAIKASHPDSTR